MSTQTLFQNVNWQSKYVLPIALLSLISIVSIYYLIPFNMANALLTIDEGNLLMEAYARRGLVDDRPLPLPGYPPLIFGVSTIAQWIVELITDRSAVDESLLTIYWLRTLAMLANILTVLIIFQILNRSHGWVAGIVGGFAWAIIPSIFDVVSLALTEPYHVVSVAASMLMLVYLMQEKSPKYAVLCTLFGALAVLGKYPNIPVLGLGVGGVLALILFDNRRWWHILGLQAFIIAATGLAIYFIFGVNSINNYEVRNFSNTPTTQLLNPQDVLLVLQASATQANIFDWRILVGFLVISTVVYLYKADRFHQVIWIGFIILAGCLVVFPSTFIVWDHLAARYVTPASPVTIVLIVLGTTTIIDSLAERLPIQPAVIFAVISIVWLIPPTLQRTNEMIESTYNNTLVSFIDWSAAAIPGGTTSVPQSDDPELAEWLYFDPIWSGYRGPLRPWVLHTTFIEEPRQVWLENNIRFLVLTENSARPDDFVMDFDALLLIKEFPFEDCQCMWSGERIAVYQLWQPAHTLSVNFGDIVRLVGYDVTISEEGVLEITPYWQLDTPTATDYQFFVHLTPPDDLTPILQSDMPLSRLDTSAWSDTTEVHIGQSAFISLQDLQDDALLENYVLRIGVYDPLTGNRLSLDTGDTSFILDDAETTQLD